MNLDLIKDEYSIAMNRISIIYNQTEWRPSFFVCTTTNVEDELWKKDILTSVELGIPIFIWDRLKEHFVGRNNIIEMECSNGMEVTEDPPIDWWSNDIEVGVTKYGTSMIVALQIVAYLGFEKIYIIGADLGFKQHIIQKILYRLNMQTLGHLFDQNHFAGNYGTPGATPEILNSNMIGAHKLAKKACSVLGVDVFNASIGGNLEIYKRVDYYSLFKSRDD